MLANCRHSFFYYLWILLCSAKKRVRLLRICKRCPFALQKGMNGNAKWRVLHCKTRHFGMYCG